jgi:hypothetical protein
MSWQTVAPWVSQILCLFSAGCLTQFAYEEFEHVPLRSAWVVLGEATPNRVQMTLKIAYRAFPSRQGNIEFDPRLDDCDSVRVLIRTELGEEFVTPGIRHAIRGVGADEEPTSDSEIEPLRTNQEPGECTVTIAIAKYSEDLSVTARNAEKLLGEGTFRTPRNVVMLAILLPATFAVDVVATPVLLSYWCLTTADCVAGLLGIVGQVLATRY